MPSATLNFYIPDKFYSKFLEQKDIIRAKIKALILKELEKR